MVSFSPILLTGQTDRVLKSGRLGLLCNQAAWRPERGEYLFETLYRERNLVRLFLPEHGLFGELQDQVALDDPPSGASLGLENCELFSLYGSSESSLAPPAAKLLDLDALVIELQDVGARYYTFLATIYYIFALLARDHIPLPVWLVDRENPAGRHVEGTPLKPGFASFIGLEGIPNRYGLTIGELSALFHDELNAEFPLHIIAYNAGAENSASNAGTLAPWIINPSPNISGPNTALLYPGQCLWEGTNVSEGRGTTRPFEVFGAPWMESLPAFNRSSGGASGFSLWNDKSISLFDPGAFLRWHRFIPVFHKYAGECCFGFQIIPRPSRPYHALGHALRIIRFIAEQCQDFAFRPGSYEAGSERPAIELLAGDPLLLDYLYGKSDWGQTKDYMRGEEEAWVRRIQKYLFYGPASKPSIVL
ncbi:hypothetical protein FACS1894151_02310 [Spirochaetia bacterium]|nr:hypothetical protein FACS1894151_02310 [Spirochaetia bacterium]